MVVYPEQVHCFVVGVPIAANSLEYARTVVESVGHDPDFGIGKRQDLNHVGPETITEGSSFTEDLDADSLALIELVEALEEELGERSVGFRIDDEDLEDLKTVGDAVDYVVARLGQAS